MAQLEKIMSIYYGHNKLPYKDYDRQIHYPIAGDSNIFVGENNTTKVRFYVDRVGGAQFTWLANVKKPDGSLAYEILSNEHINDGYVDLDLASIYLDQQGPVYIGLTGFTAEDINITENNGRYEISGNPQRVCTGVVKIMVNYVPQVLNMGTDISFSQYQQILAQLSKKLGLSQALVFYGDITNIQSGEIATTELANGQIVYDNATKWFYSWNTTSTQFSPIALNSKTYLKGALPTISINLSSTTIQDLLDMGLNNKAFMISGDDEPYIYGLHQPQVVAPNIPVTKFYRYKVGGNGELTYSSSETNVSVSYAISHGTTTNWQSTSNRVNELNSDNKSSTTNYPSNKATTDYVDTNAIASYTFNSSTYQIKFYNGKGEQVGNTIDLPVESVVVSGSYNSTTKQIILTLQNGNTITIGIGDLVSGLIPTSDIVDNLNSSDGTKVLSAKQGKELNDKKLNKLASSYHNCVYAHDDNGNEIALTYSTTSMTGENSVVVRDTNGRVKFDNPSGQWDGVNKGYGDSTYELVANKTTSISSNSTDTQYPSAKCVYDKLEEIRAVAQAKSTTYATSVDLTESDVTNSISTGLVHYFDSQGVDKVFANTTEFTTWKGAKTINQAFLTSTNFELSLNTELGATHYFVVLKGGNALYVLDADSYDFLFKENDDLNLFEEYPDRWYFDGSLLSECRAPILTETTLVGADIETSMSSLVSYMCTTPLTSLEITNLTKATNDNNPTWQISFKTHASTDFEITFPVGVRWDNGTPTFYLDTEYTIIIKKSVVNGEYIAYLC